MKDAVIRRVIRSQLLIFSLLIARTLYCVWRFKHDLCEVITIQYKNSLLIEITAQ